jgi:glycerol uptake facilitator-like aquaporin
MHTQAEFVGTLFFLFFVIATVVYRADFAGGLVKPAVADERKELVNMVGTTGAASQLMIAASFGCADRRAAGLHAHAPADCARPWHLLIAPQHHDRCVSRIAAAAAPSAALTRAGARTATAALLVYGLAPVSGGHLNPAVTFGLALTKKITALRALLYIIAQVGGAMCGTLIAASLNHDAYKAAGGGVNG